MPAQRPIVSRVPCLALGVALGLLGGLPSAPALAEDELPPTSEFFDEYDKDADGCVTAQEFSGSGEIFRLLDKDGDGVIKPADLGLPADYKPDPRRRQAKAGGEAAAGARGAKAGERMQRFLETLRKMDADEDGRVSRAEYTGPPAGFERMDRNRDGFLDAQDRAEGGEGMDRPGKAKGAGRKGEPAVSPEARDEILERAKQQFARLDANGDGRLTADESPAPMLLEMADANGDGEVTLPEMQKALLQRAARRPEPAGREPGAAAGPRSRINPAMLRTWDADKDGRVSAEEFPGKAERFQELDRDGDGALTEADLEQPPPGGAPADRPAPRPGASLIETMDADGDGRLHRGEFRGSSEDWASLDRNQDGWITSDELPAR